MIKKGITVVRHGAGILLKRPLGEFPVIGRKIGKIEEGSK
jgi:hypothetical protein